MKCPHCAHENPSDAERCTSCLQKLEADRAAEPTPAAAQATPAAPPTTLLCARCGTTNPYDARICSCCQGPLEPSASLAAESAPQAAPSRGAGKAVGAIVALGVLAGGFFAIRGLMTPESRPAERTPASTDASSAGRDAQRPPTVPKTAPQTERVPEAESRAEEQYRLALAWLKRGDPAQARRSLEEVIRKFPGSPYAARAQAQIDRLPPPAESAAARRQQAIVEFRNRYRQESTTGKKHATITEDDIGGISKVPSDMKQSKVLIPPATQAETSAAAAPDNRLTLVYAYPEDDRVTLRVAYQLGAPHQKPVHAAARLTYPAGNSLFAYGAEALAPGSGQTDITLRLSAPISVSRPASIRLMLFESQGPMFFSVTVPYP